MIKEYADRMEVLNHLKEIVLVIEPGIGFERGTLWIDVDSKEAGLTKDDDEDDLIKELALDEWYDKLA